MNKMRWMGILLLCCMMLPSVYAANDKVDVSSFIAERNKILEKKRQEYEAKAKELREIPERFAVPEVETPLRPASTCDCDDPNDVRNYTANFLYDQNGKKLYRIEPYCQCKESTSLYPTGITPTMTTEEESEDTYRWDIRY